MLLAAGSGRRYGGPKALADTGSGPWVLHALDVLAACSTKIVVVGAAADAVTALVLGRSTIAVNPDHDAGMASSLRVGLGAVPDDVDAVLVMLVDLPGVTAAVSERLLAEAGPRPRGALIRAAYGGLPGHPVLIGSDHLDALRQSLARSEPDAGGSRHLTANGVRLIECGDLADGADVDRPPGSDQDD
ncbi:NTP transferase domain-containing protein [Nakamurella sp. A5-74]|uniref:NTP transferase domain-containing protein n=1 Tax=Nakamurella sp. A5-74 TaxID=3158264 RepID=A0AAU8DN87_9ACTN